MLEKVHSQQVAGSTPSLHLLWLSFATLSNTMQSLHHKSKPLTYPVGTTTLSPKPKSIASGIIVELPMELDVSLLNAVAEPTTAET